MFSLLLKELNFLILFIFYWDGTAHAYLLNTSIPVRIYLNPLLKEEKACMSTKSADQISSLLKSITDRLGNFLLIGLCNSSANFSFQLFFLFLPKPSKKISNDQELIQSDPTSCPQNQKGNN